MPHQRRARELDGALLVVFAYGIGCGTLEIQRNVIGERELGCHAEAIDMLPTAADWHRRSRNLRRHSWRERTWTVRS